MADNTDTTRIYEVNMTDLGDYVGTNISNTEIKDGFELIINQNSFFYDRIYLILIDQREVLLSLSYGNRIFDIKFIFNHQYQSEHFASQLKEYI